MSFNKYFGIIIWCSLALASDLNAEALSETYLAAIVRTLEQHDVSPEQAAQITKAMNQTPKKRALSEITNIAMQENAKRNKTVAEIPEKARAVVGNMFYGSPKKSGSFGVDIEGRKTGDSVRNRKNSIYIMTAITRHEDEQIMYKNRINADDYFGKNKKVSLPDAMLDIETKFRTLVKQNRLLFKRTIYTGLAGDDSTRFNQHKGHVKSQPSEWSLEDSSSRKIRWLNKVYARKMTTRTSPIIENVPDEYLKVIEVLAGGFFNVTDKASTTLGDEDAYRQVAEYRKSPKRIAHLSALGLLNTIEDLVTEEDDFTLGITPQERVVLNLLTLNELVTKEEDVSSPIIEDDDFTPGIIPEKSPELNLIMNNRYIY